MAVDYLDSDVAYLVGLLVGRGQILEERGWWRAVVDFPFVRSELEGYDRFSDFLSSVVTTILPRLKDLLGEHVDLSVVKEKVALRIDLPVRHMVVRNLRQILEGRESYREFRIPQVIWSANEEIAFEFVRGFVDVAGNIRCSNRDLNGFHRVYLDVLNENWSLPVQLCNLLQQRLQVPVHEILWGHPNLRDPKASRLNQSPFREHQVRIYAHDFSKAGFYIHHKHEILQTLAKENEQKVSRGVRAPSSPCQGVRRLRSKTCHPLEDDRRLPDSLRGRHFDTYWQICAACGCPLAHKAVSEMKRQVKLMSEDDEGT